MGRHPKLRPNYIDDSQYLLRLANAVERDDIRPTQWRKEIIGKIEDLASELLRAPKKEATS